MLVQGKLWGGDRSAYWEYRFLTPETKNNIVPVFLKVLRKFCVPFISDDKLWNEFQAIRQTQNGRTKPIQQVANKIKQLQILLPKISDWECYNQLLEAMDPALLQEVRANINDDMEWDDLIEFCSKAWLSHSEAYSHQKRP